MPHKDPEKKREHDRNYYLHKKATRMGVELTEYRRKIRAAQKRYAKRHPEKVQHRHRVWLSNTPEKQMLYAARKRAKIKGFTCTLTPEDIVIPSHCPIFGTPLKKGTRKDKWDSPSLDRLDATKGYEVGNVCVISHRANTLKSDATLCEMKQLVNWWDRVSK